MTEDYISRQELDKALYEHFHEEDSNNFTDVRLGAVRNFVRDFPCISPHKPRTGHWIKYKHMIYCSECGASIEAGYLNDMNYCHNCGSYNGGGKNEE